MEKTLKKEYIKEVTRVISASFGFSSVSHNLRSSLFSISQRGSDPSLGDSSSLKIIPLPISFNFAPGLHRFGSSIFFLVSCNLRCDFFDSWLGLCFLLGSDSFLSLFSIDLVSWFESLNFSLFLDRVYVFAVVVLRISILESELLLMMTIIYVTIYPSY